MFSGFIRADLISPDIILLQKYDNWYMTMAFPLIDICKHFQIVRNSHILVGLLTQVSNQSSIMICPDVIPGRPYNSCARHSYTAYRITVYFSVCKYRASFLRQTMNWYVSFVIFGSWFFDISTLILILPPNYVYYVAFMSSFDGHRPSAIWSSRPPCL